MKKEKKMVTDFAQSVIFHGHCHGFAHKVAECFIQWQYHDVTTFSTISYLPIQPNIEVLNKNNTSKEDIVSCYALYVDLTFIILHVFSKEKLLFLNLYGNN